MGSLGARGVGACNDCLRRDTARCNKAGHRTVGRELKAKGKPVHLRCALKNRQRMN
jgi:hypothetical protein